MINTRARKQMNVGFVFLSFYGDTKYLHRVLHHQLFRDIVNHSPVPGWQGEGEENIAKEKVEDENQAVVMPQNGKN